MLVIKHVRNQWDIFSGVGYDRHTRVMIDPRDGYASLVYGQRLPASVVKTLVSSFNPDVHYQNLEIK